MTQSELISQILETWHRHNNILLFLLEEIPAEGFAAVPSQSRGRDVARQITHMYRNRLEWIHYHETGKRPTLERFDKGEPPERSQLTEFMRESGEAVAQFLEKP